MGRRIDTLGWLLGSLIFAGPSWALAAELPAWAEPVTTGNIFVFGMQPNEIVRWELLEQTMNGGVPLAVSFAKETTTDGETVLDEVLATKHSIGIYMFHPERQMWMPLWERVTGRLGVDFVEDYELADLTGDGVPELCVRIRYYGGARALDFIVKEIDGARVRDVFEAKSIYHGDVTTSQGYITISRPVRDEEGFDMTELYHWHGDDGFEKIREIRNKVEK